MIPESEIPQNPEHEVKPKLGNIFVNEKILEEYSDKIYKLILFFVSIAKRNYRLTKIGMGTYYLELMFILLNIFQPQRLMKKTCWQRPFFLEEKRQKALEKKLCCKFIELIRVKKAMMQNIKLIEYKHSSVYLKTDN